MQTAAPSQPPAQLCAMLLSLASDYRPIAVSWRVLACLGVSVFLGVLTQ